MLLKVLPQTTFGPSLVIPMLIASEVLSILMFRDAILVLGSHVGDDVIEKLHFCFSWHETDPLLHIRANFRGLPPLIYKISHTLLK